MPHCQRCCDDCSAWTTLLRSVIRAHDEHNYCVECLWLEYITRLWCLQEDVHMYVCKRQSPYQAHYTPFQRYRAHWNLDYTYICMNSNSYVYTSVLLGLPKCEHVPNLLAFISVIEHWLVRLLWAILAFPKIRKAKNLQKFLSSNQKSKCYISPFSSIDLCTLRLKCWPAHSFRMQ